MVLQEIEDPNKGSFPTDRAPNPSNDAFPPSDSTGDDYQADSAQYNNGARLKISDELFESLPKPWFPLSIFTQSPRRALADKAVNRAAQTLGRPPNNNEQAALSFHSTAAYKTRVNGQLFGAIVGYGMYKRGSKEWKFPFRKPDSTFNPNKIGSFKGRQARLTWDFMRFGAYQLVWGVPISFTFVLISIVVGTTGILKDPRLEDYRNALDRRVRAQQRLPSSRSGASTVQRRPQETESPAGWGDARADDSDDMSPTGGAGLIYPSATPAMEPQRKAADAQTRHGQNSTRSQDEQRDSTGFILGDDQSNETSHKQSAAKSSSTNSPASTMGGSSWERLRRRAAENDHSNSDPGAANRTSIGGQQRTAGEQRVGSTLGDSFTFSQTDEEKQLAKAGAQKEFDTRVERERQGKDFSSGGWGRKGT